MGLCSFWIFSLLSFVSSKLSLLSPAERGDTVLALSVRPKPFPPSVRLFCPGAYLGNRFSDCIVILQEYVLAYEDGSHQVLLHCTNWKYSYGPLFLSNIHSRQIDFLSGLIDLGNWFSDFIIPCRRFWGGSFWRSLSVLPLSVRPASFCPYGRLWTMESWPKAHCLLPLTKWDS